MKLNLLICNVTSLGLWARVECSESAVDADVQGRSERVSQVRDVRAAQRPSSSHVDLGVVDRHPRRRTSRPRQAGAQSHRRPLERLL